MPLDRRAASNSVICTGLFASVLLSGVLGIDQTSVAVSADGQVGQQMRTDKQKAVASPAARIADVPESALAQSVIEGAQAGGPKEEPEGDIFTNQENLLKIAAGLDSQAKSVLTHATKLGSDMRAQQKEEVSNASRFIKKAVKLNTQVAELIKQVEVDDHAFNDEEKVLQRELAKSQANILENGKMEVDATGKLASDDKRMQDNHGNMMSQLQKAEDAVMGNRKVSEGLFQSEEKEISDLMQYVHSAAAKLEAAVDKIKGQVHEVYLDMSHNRNASKRFARAEHKRNADLENQFEKLAGTLDDKLLQSLRKVDEIKKALRGHNASSLQERHVVMQRHQELNGRLKITGSEILAEISKMENALKQLQATFQDSKERTDRQVKQTEETGEKLVHSVDGIAEGLAKEEATVSAIERHVADGQVGDRKTALSLQHQSQQVSQDLENDVQSLGNSIQSASNTIAESDDLQEREAKVIAQEDDIIAKALRKSHELIQDVGSNSQQEGDWSGPRLDGSSIMKDFKSTNWDPLSLRQ